MVGALLVALLLLGDPKAGSRSTLLTRSLIISRRARTKRPPRPGVCHLTFRALSLAPLRAAAAARLSGSVSPFERNVPLFFALAPL